MSEEKPNDPKLRFPGFTDPWEQRKFSEIATLRRGLTYSPNDITDKNGGVRVLRSSNISGDQFELHDDDVFVREDAVKIAPAEDGDILITAANGSSNLVGKRARICNLPGKTVHGGFMLLASTGDSYYLNAAMGAQWYRRFLHMGVAGGNGALGNLDMKALLDYELLTPSRNERKKIGSLFNRLDSLITLHQRKLDHLKEMKKGLLQKMFPKNGESIPELRFPGFTDPWEQRKFSDLFSYERPDAYIVNNDEYDDSNPTPVLTANKGFILGYTAETRTHEGPCVIFDDFTLDCKLVTFPFMVKSSAMKILHCHDGVDLTFAYERLCSAKIEALGHARHYISVVQNTESAIPSYEEQSAIGRVLSNLDTLITLHQRKLDHLKQMKKGLLQQMFV